LIFKSANDKWKLISVLQLGNVDYATGLRLQQKLVELRKAGQIGDALLLLEHTPVITLGRNAKHKNIVASPELLKQRGVEVFDCDRGGDVTFHGPGQLVAYPIFDLRGFPSSQASRKTLGAVEYVRRLEEVLIRICAEYGIPAKRIPGLTGVWTEFLTVSSRAEPRDSLADRSAESRACPERAQRVEEDLVSSAEAKIAAIGVHISRGVTSHGFALNVNTDLTYFNLIIPCGITSKPVTSMQRELGRPLALDKIAEVAARNFGSVFNSQILWVESLEALDRSLDIPARPPSELRKLHKEEETFWA
jgi:lipoyl(octanoyl) transferase